MAKPVDPESQLSHEQTPLLGDRDAGDRQPEERRQSEDQESDGRPTHDAHADEDDDPKAEPGPKKLSWYLWRLFWILVVALIASLFIKGWIDAGSDVDVSFQWDVERSAAGLM